MLTKPQQQFVSWLRENQPNIYAAAARSAGRVTSQGLSAADTTANAGGGWWDSFVGAAKQLVPVVVQARSQKQLLDVQLKRAQRGLPPLDAGQIAPTVRVQAGLTPAMKKILIPALMVAGAGLLYFMFKGKKKK